MKTRNIKNFIKNSILCFITGAAYGGFIIGMYLLGAFGTCTTTTIILTASITWLAVFTYANCRLPEKSKKTLKEA